MQAAQAVHAAALFAFEHPEAFSDWHDHSSYVVVLQVPDLAHLTARYSCLPEYAKRVLNREPDLGDQATAFAVLGNDAGRLLSDLPLALRETVMS